MLTYAPNQFLGWNFFCRFLQQDMQLKITIKETVLNQMVDKVISKKSGGKKSMKECRRGNMLPHGVKRLMNKVTRFPIDRKTGPPSFLALVALICRNPIDIVRKCC